MRDFGRGGYKAGCRNAPPPLHVHPDNPQAAWFPLERPRLAAQPPGPVMVRIPAPGGFAGDDPTDPAAQTVPRIRTRGGLSRLHERA